MGVLTDLHIHRYLLHHSEHSGERHDSPCLDGGFADASPVGREL